jgi:hypothetical protein
MKKYCSINNINIGRLAVTGVAFSIIMTSMMMSSCKEDSSFLGYDLTDLNDSLSSSVIDTLSVEMFNEDADSIMSNNGTSCVVGNFSDAEFGSVQASSIVQFGMSSTTDTFNIEANNVKATLSLYRTFNTKAKEALTLNFYSVTKRLYDSVSYSSAVNPKLLVDYTTKIGSKVINTSDTTFTIDLPAVASLLAQNKYVVGNKRFIDIFKGIYIEAEKVGANGEITTFNLGSSLSNLTIAYNTKSKTTGADTVKTVVLYNYSTLRTSNVNFYNHSANYAKANDSVFYASGLAGYKVRIAFPTLHTLQNSKMSVNKAEIIVQADTLSNTFVPYSSTFELFRNATNSYQSITDNSYNNYKMNENLQLKLDITNHIQEYISSKLTTPDLFIRPTYNYRLLTHTRFTNKYGKKVKLRIVYSNLR